MGRDPCGAEYERELELGTRKFFDSVERHRYTQYAPWMPRVMGFDQFRGARLLEIGCGMGTDLLQFARGGAGCVGQFRCGVFQRRVAPHAGYHGRDCEVHRVLRRGGVAKVMLYHRNSLNYWVEIVLRRGVLGGEFLRGRSAGEIMSRVIEFSDHDARPLVKVYSRKETRALFAQFSEVAVEVEQLTRDELRVFKSVVPAWLFEKLRSRIGWNVIVTARK